jgi:hypothetical protein
LRADGPGWAGDGGSLPPATGRPVCFLLRLGDRCPSRRCAGAGCGPPEPVVVLTVDVTRRPWVEPPVASRTPSSAGQPVWSGMPLHRVGCAARLRRGLVDRGSLPVGVARRPRVGLPVTSRILPWLGDRRVPSRRCAGGGTRPACARSRVDCGRGPTPLAWSLDASRLSGGDSLFKLVHISSRKQRSGLYAGSRIWSGPGVSGVLRVPAVSGRRAVPLPRGPGVVSSSCDRNCRFSPIR